jgi:hypothetical protein
MGRKPEPDRVRCAAEEPRDAEVECNGKGGGRSVEVAVEGSRRFERWGQRFEGRDSSGSTAAEA